MGEQHQKEGKDEREKKPIFIPLRLHQMTAAFTAQCVTEKKFFWGDETRAQCVPQHVVDDEI